MLDNMPSANTGRPYMLDNMPSASTGRPYMLDNMPSPSTERPYITYEPLPIRYKIPHRGCFFVFNKKIDGIKNATTGVKFVVACLNKWLPIDG